MISLFMPVLLFVTVIASVSLGVFAAYAAVICILNAFGRSSQQHRAGPPAPGSGSHAEPRQRRLTPDRRALAGPFTLLP